MCSKHNLNTYNPKITINRECLKLTKSHKVLGVYLNQHLKWDDHVNYITSSCYGTLSVLKKLKHLAPYSLRKQLAETLILSKLNYADTAYYPKEITESTVRRSKFRCR